MRRVGQVGISVGTYSIVSERIVEDAGGVGISARETIVDHTVGPVDASVNRGDNYCEGTATASAFCPRVGTSQGPDESGNRYITGDCG